MSHLSSPEDENSCCESDSQLVKQNKGRKVRGRTQRGHSGESTSSSSCPDNVPMTTVDGGYVEQAVGSTPMASYNAERMRRKLQFFFMNPIEKWQARRRFPYKFFVQVVKIVLVTIQLCLFAHSRYNHINYTWDNRVTFSHLFLNGWDESREVESYPPSVGPLALYVQNEFFETIDYAIEGYQNLSKAIGPYSYPNEDNSMAPLHLCLYRYKEGTIFGFNESYIFNSEIDTLCLNLTGNVTEIGSEAYLASKDVIVSFSALVKATLEMSVKTVNFKAAGPIAPPDCYQFNIIILFDNRDHDGQMLLSLDAEPIRLNCNGNIEYKTESNIDDTLRSILNMLVILICILSFALCTRAVYRAQLLRGQTVQFFRTHFGTELSWDGKLEFLNMWYIMIICNDVLLIIGSAIKEQIQRRHFAADEWNTCSVLLGIGNLLVWFGVLRYLGFFKTYNVVILTLKRAAPKISRFLLCALLIYAGFTFCGWLILGPYHIKFRSLAITSECLFSLINGDDMFATFTTMSGKSNMLWWFSRIYLYSFISLYIYVVLSLFISVIMDAYDTIKKYYKEGFPESDLKMFVGTINPQDYIAASTVDEEEGYSFIDTVYRFFKCRRRNPASEGPTGYTSLHPKP
ncbi:Mucolipin [Sergentomyia squamirostris]